MNETYRKIEEAMCEAGFNPPEKNGGVFECLLSDGLCRIAIDYSEHSLNVYRFAKHLVLAWKIEDIRVDSVPTDVVVSIIQTAGAYL